MNSGNLSLSERDRHLLAHIGRYRITFQEVLSRLFFGGSDPQKVLDELRGDGLIDSIPGFGGNRRAYKLTERGVGVLNISRGRARAPGSESLPARLAVLAYCLLKGRPRILLEDDELKELFDGFIPRGRYHCLERSRAATRVDHLIVPGSATPVTRVMESLKSRMVAAMKSHTLRPWVRYRLYGFAVLVDSKEREEQINREFDRTNYDKDVAIRQVAMIRVERVPRENELEEALHVLAKTSQTN